VLLDAIASVTDTPTAFGQMPGGLRAVQLDEGNRISNNYFLKNIRTLLQGIGKAPPKRAWSRPCAGPPSGKRRYGGEQNQPQHNSSTLLAAKKPAAEILDEMFVRTLSRKPSEPRKGS